MTQLEIATKIFCANPNYSTDEAWEAAGNLIKLSEGIGSGALGKKNLNNQIDLEEQERLKELTIKRTEEIIELGFEWVEEDNIFIRNEDVVSTKHIEGYSYEEWDCMINAFRYPDELKPEPQITPELNSTTEDLFNGNTYIEFEMSNTICRLYRLENKIASEEDLQVTKKTESKFIVAHSDNEFYNLGITIFKK